ncbi:23S rRNA (uracil(1939)-C(5))-methyltransferase RlmD [Roseburia hominis]|uniref:23S rRNA (uracil(1939)-C(5))-methyltransferase RlmD n=1 Tax=Roseburia hominis TaxID=301301 RepID=UPI0039F644E3
MKKNDSIELKIEDMGVDGEGIGKYEGMTFFVKDAVIGDTIRAGITKLKKNYGYARVQEILEPSPYRVQPECPLYARCGGCQIQAMDYRQQLCYKQKKVRGNLIRIGGFAPELIDSVMEEIVGMEQPYRYRNKAQFPIGEDRDGMPVAGFYAARTHSIIPVEDCKLGVTQNEQVLGVVLSYMRENGVRPYDETTGRGLVRHVLIRYGFTSKELMVCLVINGETLPQEKKLVDALCKIEGMTSISVNINRKNTNVILGEETRTVWGSDYITDQIHLRDCDHDFVLTDTAIAYHISPQSFYQVNPGQTEKLYSLALSYAGLTGKETVWDLYCGIGTISLFLAQKAGKVYGVEIVPQAIEDARSNAALNGITNASFFVGKAEEVLPEFYEKESRKPDADMLHPDVIVVDPPRKGCDEKCLETMLRMEPDRIVYVSCDPATLARDLKILCGGGYELRKVRPVDQFGHTTHVETVVLLSKGMFDSRKVKVDFSLEDMDLSEFKGKATYEQIKAYVLEQTGLKVSSLYIAQIKKKCGLDVGENFNLPKSENARQPQCTPEKEEAIMQAFKHFGIV